MNKTAKSFSIVTGFAIVTRLISFIFKIWVSRALGAQTVGLYQIAMSVIMMLLTLTSGAPTVLSRKIAEAKGDSKRQNSYVTASLILGVTISGAICALLFGLRSKLGFLFSDERCLPIFLIMLPTLVTSTVYASLRSWFWGKKRFLAFSSTELLDEVVKICLSVVFAGGLVASLNGAKGIALAMTLSDALCAVTLAVMYFIMGGRFARPHGFKELTLRTIPLSATRMITSAVASVTALALPELLVKYGMSVAEATAEYGRIAGMALPLIMAPVMLVSSLSVVLIPDIAELKAQGDLPAVKKKLSAATIFAMLVACVFFVLYLPLGKHLGVFLFGDEKAGTFVSYCSVMLFSVVMAQVTTPMLNSLGKERATFIHSLIGSIILLPCTLLLPKYVGVYSMAIGSAACFTVVAILNVLSLNRIVGSFIDFKKTMALVGISIPLAVLGLFSDRLMSAVAGRAASVATIGVLLMFFLFIFINAFNIVDITGYLRLLRPAYVSGKRRGRIRAPKDGKTPDNSKPHLKRISPRRRRSCG